jgi:predicted metalloprotease
MKLPELGYGTRFGRAAATVVLGVGVASCTPITQAERPVDPIPLTAEDTHQLEGVFGETQDFWLTRGVDTRRTRLTILSGSSTARCGSSTFGSGDSARYCRPTDTVILTAGSVHDYSVVLQGKNYVVAHETAHAAQLRQDAPKGANRELQADCYAGAFAADRYPEQVLASAAMRVIVGTPFDFVRGSGSHGSVAQRQAAYAQGFMTDNCATS